MKSLQLLAMSTALSAALSAAMVTQFIPSAIARTEIFGQPGRDGISGRSGRSGNDGQNQSIQLINSPVTNSPVTNSLQTLDLSGSRGENGDNGGYGEDAQYCQSPRNVPYNLQGARGGHGGHGGHGGNGGNGGNVTIFFSELAQLRNLQLRNSGGMGGQGGRGGPAGRGCQPYRQTWTIDICEWALMRRSRKEANASWQEVDREKQDCEESGHKSYEHDNETYEYRWEHRGVVDHDRYYATAGEAGRPGQEGRRGTDGSYGTVVLVPGVQIPQETLTVQAPIAQIQGQSIGLLRNNWLNRTDLGQYLAPGSNVSGEYQLLQTVRNQFQVEWKTNKSIDLLGNPAIAARIDKIGDLSFQIPGHLEYRNTRNDKGYKLEIVNGIAPGRLKQIKFRGFDQFKDARNFALIDEGKLMQEITSLEIQVKVSNGKQTISDTYAINNINGKLSTENTITVLGDIYKLQLGDQFAPLLQPGQPLTYTLTTTQTTRSGATYQAQMRVKQVVDQVTFPSVDYLPSP